MHLHLKDPTVRMHGISFEIGIALIKAMKVWKTHGMLSLTVTSARDGQHKPGSKHYQGDALDLRTRDVPDAIGMRDDLQAELGPDYDVILESDHIHLEYDPPKPT